MDIPPILEYDPSPEAIVRPGRRGWDLTLPERWVLTFFADVAADYAAKNDAPVIATNRWETGTMNCYEVEIAGRRVGFVHVHVGAPVAAGLLEFLIAYGGRRFVACGGCGVLDPTIAAGHVLVPTIAVRDEGTSYHYLPPSREVALTPAAVAAVRQTLAMREIPFLECKTWTTDAFYRETRAIVERRRAEGCVVVEMECSALAAVAQFRGAEFAQILYGGDSLGDAADGYAYDERDWWKNLPVREKVFQLALEAAAT